MQFAVQMINTVVRRDTRAMLVKELATCRVNVPAGKHVAHWEEGSTDVAPYQMQFAVQMINTVVPRDTPAMLVKELATCRV
jgi:hypothetical protein